MFTIQTNEEVYTAPVCTIVSVKVQGVLCGSLDGTDTPVDDGELDF